ncbi:hypothetical protein OS493_012376 [Desmophyllum pertusum]|uniref:Ubiquitin-like protease family profile domain-containing protein n=1 Tax=Desmophyllum pertusum TaxID=174260 RepID=A0A9W9ZQP7_9CNID|nr:hypothetical protein OS493_012376 [Desmophyllum pertusum]
MNVSGVAPQVKNPYSVASPFQVDDSVESEFSTQTLNTALLQINNEWNVTRLQALEATEHTIHRNILPSLKTKLKDFKKGDRVILSNPKLNLSSGLQHQSCDPFCPLNIIGVIIDALPGGMFKVQMEDGDEIAVRSLVAGQMALFREQTQSSSDGEDDTSSEQLNVKQIQDSVSAFAFAVRKEMYKKKLKLPSGISNESVGAQFDILYDCLVVVCWQLFLHCEEGHDCIKCLSGSGDCQHPCCQNLALKFVVKCGLMDNVPDDIIVAEQHVCSVTSRDLYTLKPNEWVNNVIIDYIGKDLMAECGDVFIAETLLVECLREEKYNQCLPVDFNVKKDNYKKFIFPVDTLSSDHWWCVIVDISKKQYMELDSECDA